MSITLERVRPALMTDECRAARQDLCRLAVGGATRWRVADLARHARGCGACAAWVDGLAVAVGWLERAGAATPPPGLEELAESARQALLRELAARLARDLLDDAAREPGRTPPARRVDARRLLALAGARALRREPWRSALRLAHLPPRLRPPGEDAHSLFRSVALRLAARLDPLGLDVALGHIAILERTGQRAKAQREAERALELVR